MRAQRSIHNQTKGLTCMAILRKGLAEIDRELREAQDAVNDLHKTGEKPETHDAIELVYRGLDSVLGDLESLDEIL